MCGQRVTPDLPIEWSAGVSFDEANLSAILWASPDAVLVVDANGRIDFASDRVETLFGYSSIELESLSVDRLVPERYRQAYAESRAKFFSDPTAPPLDQDLRFQGRRRDDSEFPFEISLSFVGEGEGLRAVCSVRDASGKQKLEDGLRLNLQRLEKQSKARHADATRSQEHLRLFVRHAPSAVAMLDKKMRYLLVSHRWMEDYGLGERDIIGLSHYDVFPDVPARWKEAHRRCLAGEPQKCEEDWFVRPDGKLEWLRWELLPWRNSGGQIGGIMVLTEVITQRKVAEMALIESRAQLEQRVETRTRELQQAKAEADRANQFKSRFLTVAGHDLRQPLQAAVLYLSVLRHKIAEQELQAICDKACAPLESMSEILDVVLDAAKLEDGEIEPYIVEVRVTEAVDRVLASNRAQAEEKGLALIVEVVDCVIRTDPVLLARVLDNLVGNSIRYTAKGSITLKVERRAGVARILVTDTGIGIPAHALDAIFEEHVQLGNPARDHRQGLGLGLSIVKYLTTLLGLPLKLHSTEGKGSTFEISVPLGASALRDEEAPGAASPEKGQPDRAWRVLLVEDDQAVRESALMLLNLSGLDTVGAGSGDEALALIEQGLEPRVIISDLRLPGYGGLEVIRRVRARLGRQISAVLMTGDAGISSADLADVPDCSLLHKPVNGDQLAELVCSLGDMAANMAD
jgi:PAS domain S-box-containing protein